MYVRFDPSLEQLVSTALQRFDAGLRAALPKTAPKLLRSLHGVPTRPEQILSVVAFPHFVLPYWISPPRARIGDAGFQSDVLYSTISGYYSIRLSDNIADNDCPRELRRFTPCAAYFDSEFIRPYTKYFSTSHEFWNLFDRFWAQQAESSCADSLLKDVDESSFASLSSKKFTAAKIPVSAIHFRYRELGDSLDRWLRFVDCLGDFAQFNNDFFDWNHDSKHKITTYLSSESKRRAPGENVTTWFLKEGFDWGVAELKARFEVVRTESEALGTKEVLDWTIARGIIMDRNIAEARAALELVRTFGRITSGKRSQGGIDASQEAKEKPSQEAEEKQ
jgi:hypothetical protein